MTADSSPGSVVQVAANFAEGGPAMADPVTKNKRQIPANAKTNFLVFKFRLLLILEFD